MVICCDDYAVKVMISLPKAVFKKERSIAQELSTQRIPGQIKKKCSSFHVSTVLLSCRWVNMTPSHQHSFQCVFLTNYQSDSLTTWPSFQIAKWGEKKLNSEHLDQPNSLYIHLFTTFHLVSPYKKPIVCPRSIIIETCTQFYCFISTMSKLREFTLLTPYPRLISLIIHPLSNLFANTSSPIIQRSPHLLINSIFNPLF